MELHRIQIKNFRSIKDETIHFDKNCKILLGKNEAGKSNILKGVAAVFGEYKVSNRDKRKKIDNEHIDEYVIRAILKLDTADFLKIQLQLKKKFSNFGLIKFKNIEGIQEFIKLVFHEFILRIDVENDSEPHFRYWTYNNNSKIETEQVLYKNENSLTIDNTGEKLNLVDEVFNIVKVIYKENPIKCQFWQYDESYLLPNSIEIEEFKSNPTLYKPLLNVFELSNRDEIGSEFENALEEDGDYSNLLEQVSTKVTKTFQGIWKDFKQTKIQLIPNKDEILIKVVNKAKYSFEDRSEGFKKLISMLLMLSTRARSKKLDDKHLILIDEPDQSLYPSSARYLKDELLEISSSAKIIYSTHSQYMIDSNDLDRHLIVEMRDDVTSTKKLDKNSPFSNDELLRNAIGTSIFEVIQDKNIIFEGFLDKKLFDSYCSFNNKSKIFTDFGKVYLGGISNVETLVQLLILANKKFIIVADSDQASRDKRTEFSKNYPDHKDCWLAYADMSKEMSTMEDFFETDHIKNQIMDDGYPDYKYDENKNAIVNIENAVSKDKEKKQHLKNKIVTNANKKDIKSDYENLIQELMNRLKAL